MKVKNLEIGNLFLAPMAGVSDVGFRHVCKKAGADLTFTEMVSSKALSYNSEKTKELLFTSSIEKPVAVQIFGHEPDVMAWACQSEYLDKFDLIDINFGCPAPKIVNNGDGSALLKDLKLVQKIVTNCVKATPKPVSCKFRKGYLNDKNVALEMAKICSDCGASLITIHGRTKSQMYSGEVDLETIAKVKACVNIKVVGNGDVVDLASYNKMKQTGVDGVMIGRGALGNPNIFNEIKGLPKLNKLDLIKEQINILSQFYGERYITTTMRKHFLWYVSGINGASSVKQKLATCTNVQESLEILENLLKK